MMTRRRMQSVGAVVAVVALVMVPEVRTVSVAAADPTERQLGEAAGQVVRGYLANCHLVVATWHRHSPVLDYVLR